LSTRDHPDWWRPVGGSNAQDSTLERRSLVWNDSDIQNGTVPDDFYTEVADKGKFFTRGCRGMLEQLEIYCIRTGAGALRLRYSPHPCIGPINEVAITPGAAWAWVAADIEEMWNYDSLFIWVHACSDDVSWAYDAELPYDGHETEDNEATWQDLAIRPFIRVVYTGETPGDVPVSGVVNTIEIPSVASTYSSAVAVVVPNAFLTLICTVDGAGEVIAAAVNLDVSVIPTAGPLPGAVVYRLEIWVDGRFAWAVTNRSLTQSCVAPSGRAPDGVFYQCTVADPAWDLTAMSTIITLKFRRSATVYVQQFSGGPANVTGTLYVNLMR